MSNRPHNYRELDMEAFKKMYAKDRRAVRKFAEANCVGIQTVYDRMAALGIKKRSGGDANKGTAQ